jgi:peptidoglycan hydrolase CwlO-like protein
VSCQIEELRKKMAVKQEEVAAAKQESEKRGAQVAALQAEIDKQGAVIRDMQVRQYRPHGVVHPAHIS